MKMANLILNFGRCSHGTCIFCGYGRIRGPTPNETEINRCFDDFFRALEEDEVKIFGSGSFLDERQIPRESRLYFIKKCREKKLERITIESRPEYITEDSLSDFAKLKITVAIGLESADNELLKKLNKGFTKEDFESAAKRIHDAGHLVRAYLLANPPYAKDIRKSLHESVDYALSKSDSVVIINLIPHGMTPLMRKWLEGSWMFLSRGEFEKLTDKWRGNSKVETDFETFRFKPSIPEHLRDNLAGVGEWFLTHPHFEIWQDYLQRWYIPQKDKIGLFLPCAYKKPYSDSKTHKGIIKALGPQRGRFHEIMLSNAGVIPRDFENHYPFNSYDWDEKEETEEIKKRYVEVISQRIEKYLKYHGNAYLGIVCYLKYDSESYIALEKACEKVGIEFKNLLTQETYMKIKSEKKPLQSSEALNDLEKGIKWCLQNFT
jgi:hypothetical protein